MDSTDIPYRIALVESSLVAALPAGVVGIAIKHLDWPYALEQKQFPRFSVDRYFVAIVAARPATALPVSWNGGYFGIASTKANRKGPRLKLCSGARSIAWTALSPM
jgi:hypothetical protein